jgi:hypothetical protein
MSDRVLVDRRLAWLLRASARLDLIEIGEMDLDEALDIHFVADLLEAIPTICPCYTAHDRHFDRFRPEPQQQQFRRWRGRR